MGRHLVAQPGSRDASRQLIGHLHRSIALDDPDRLVEPASWVEHIPFAFWIVEALKPSMFVELGTQSGNSFAAFAQAVKTLRLPCACYAIDTWKGDPHAGLYDETVFAEWQAYHDRQFSGFSKLIRSSFSDAVGQFSDGSIDLLHLDGYHSFDVVGQDFQMWLPKMSRNGVVLMHDINVREGDFGAWLVWQHLEGSYPSFAFLHGHGLGVLGVGRDFPESISWLFDAARQPDELTEIRKFFFQLGRRLTLQRESARQRQTIVELESRLAQQQRLVADLAKSREQAHALESTLMNERERAARADAEHDVTRRSLEMTIETERSRLAQLGRELDTERNRISQLGHELDAMQEDRDRQTRIIREFAAVAGLTAMRADARPRVPHPLLEESRRSRISKHLTAWRSLIGVLGALTRSGHWRETCRTLTRFSLNPRRASQMSTIAESGLFDEHYYLEHNPDVAASRMHPLVHYAFSGAFEGRRPNAVFDPAYYLEHYRDVAQARCEPLSHFLRHGAKEARNPGPDFDSAYYLAMNPDVRAAGVNPLLHFWKTGWREGRNPSPWFDCEAYATRYEDVRRSGINPLVHFIEVGRLENRDAGPAADAPLPAPDPVLLRSNAIEVPRSEAPVVVCLSHVSPWPPYAGNAYRIHRMLRSLRRAGFRIVPVIVPLSGEAPDDASIRKVQEEFGNVVVVERSGAVRYALNDIPDVLGPLDGKCTPDYSILLGEGGSTGARRRELLIIDRTYCPDAAIAVVTRLHSGLARYILLAEYVWMTRVLPILDDRALKVLDTHDVLSTKKDKVLHHGVSDFWLEAEEEVRRLVLADLVIAIQEGERKILQQLLPSTRVVTAAVDFEIRGDARMPDGRCILYVASGNPINVKGLRDFLKFAWPTISKLVAEAELIVAGQVGAAIDVLPSRVQVLGVVPDLENAYRGARVVINPALAGTGYKIKTVEALTHLRPIVTWPAGVDGLPFELESLCDVARDWYEFASRVVARLTCDGQETFSPAEQEVIRRATSPDLVYQELVPSLCAMWDERRVGGKHARSPHLH